MLVLDSGGVSRLARRNQDSAAAILVLRREGLWPPLVPSMVLVESLTGRQGTDAAVNRFLKVCEVDEDVPERLARRAAALRALARRGSPVDAVVVAAAELGGTVLSGDLRDLRALATHAADVAIRRV